MIVGNGLIGNYFRNHASDELKNNFIIFASGVSKSTETDFNPFLREFNLIKDTLSEKKIIYFSSSLVDVADNPYYRHKKNMEEYLIENSDCLIIRIPQLIGFGGNKNNLFNFIKTSIINNTEIITNEKLCRAFLDIEDLLKIVEYCKHQSGILTLSYIEKIKVVDICRIVGDCLGISPIINTTSTMSSFDFVDNSSEINTAIKDVGIEVSGYNERIVKKYI